ncbi:PH domain-containing protein, partial [Shigella sonnei]|uniref:PH domain-containing protein n=1 Tax=Shigella sonnei TaxID=624 RepID=UPI0039679AA7
MGFISLKKIINTPLHKKVLTVIKNKRIVMTSKDSKERKKIKDFPLHQIFFIPHHYLFRFIQMFLLFY